MQLDPVALDPRAVTLGKPGSVATSLGLRVRAPCEYTEGVVNIRFARSCDESGSEDNEETPKEAPQEGEATDGSSPKTFEQMARLRALHEEGAQERLLRVTQADQMCFDSLSKIKSIAEDQKMVLSPNEKQTAVLKVVGFAGMPAAPGKSIMGSGFIMLTSIGEKSRVHMKLTESASEFHGDEEWGAANRAVCVCCCIKQVVQMSGRYTSSHRNQMYQTAFYANDHLVQPSGSIAPGGAGYLPPSGSIFHVQTYLDDSAEGATEFKSRKKIRPLCCRQCCKGFCRKYACCGCLCPKWCPTCSCCWKDPCCGLRKTACCWMCIDWCPCCKRVPTKDGGEWQAAAGQQCKVAMEKLEVVVQEKMEEVSYKFPETPQVKALECATRSGVTLSIRHKLEFTYLNPRTNEIEVCTALIDPTETAEAKSKFLSEMSALVRPYPANMQPSMAPEMQTMDVDAFFGDLMQNTGGAVGVKGLTCRAWCWTCCTPCITCCKCCLQGCKQSVVCCQQCCGKRK